MTQIKYIGLDLETTGLHPDDGAAIVELGMIAFDDTLTEADHFTSLVYSGKAAFHRVNDMADVVDTMHTETGLWDELDEYVATYGVADLIPDTVEAHALAWIDSLDMPAGHRPMMVGNSITFDRDFLHVEMPKLLARFSHRSLDATSVVEAAALAGADPAKIREHAAGDGTKHRALDDLRAAQRQITAALAAIRDA